MPWTQPAARLFSELDAVNAILLTKNLEPLDSLAANIGNVEVASILLALNAVDLEVQSRGWSWNTNYAFTLTREDDSNEILVPDETLWVRSAYWDTSGQNAAPSLRGSRLWDAQNNTFAWTTDLQVDLCFRSDYAEMPQSARNYIAALGGHRYQGKSTGNPIVVRITEQEVGQALTLLEHYEDISRPKNQMTQNLDHIAKIRGLGVRRNRY